MSEEKIGPVRVMAFFSFPLRNLCQESNRTLGGKLANEDLNHNTFASYIFGI